MKYLLALLLLCSLHCGPAAAHALNNGYVELELQGPVVSGAWRVELGTLAALFELDGDADGRLSWGELRSDEPRIAASLLSLLTLRRADVECQWVPGAIQIDPLPEGTFLYLPLSGHCAQATGTVTLDYHYLFDRDASHRALLQLAVDGRVVTGVLSPSQPTFVADMNQSSLHLLLDYWVEGLWHIWLGYDHLLFLLAMLLPLFAHRAHGRWVITESKTRIVREVIKTVSAFTLAHSITLILASLDVLEPNPTWVETLIALSVALSGFNVLVPIFQGRHWQLAFAFGLIHGFGFAGALQVLSLPPHLFIGSLLSFNLGVECGQLVVVALVLPLLLSLRRALEFRRFAMPLMACAIALTGMAWAWQRQPLF